MTRPYLTITRVLSNRELAFTGKFENENVIGLETIRKHDLEIGKDYLIWFFPRGVKDSKLKIKIQVAKEI